MQLSIFDTFHSNSSAFETDRCVVDVWGVRNARHFDWEMCRIKTLCLSHPLCQQICASESCATRRGSSVLKISFANGGQIGGSPRPPLTLSSLHLSRKARRHRGDKDEVHQVFEGWGRDFTEIDFAAYFEGKVELSIE